MSIDLSRRSKSLPSKSPWSNIALAAAFSLLCLGLRSDSLPTARLSARMSRLPQRTLWAWERPEDLQSIDPATTAIAVLDQTILFIPQPFSLPRRQPLVYPVGTSLIVVVRLETMPGAALDPAAEPRVADLLLRSAAHPGIAALQVDFDATRSQRPFYTALLNDLRRRMPPDLPLSITALASWCSNDDWIARLPVDEAVPMLFRMEPDRRHAPPDLPQFQIREPLCMASAGISTHEPWPADLAGKRIYVFPDRGWREDLPLLAERKLP